MEFHAKNKRVFVAVGKEGAYMEGSAIKLGRVLESRQKTHQIRSSFHYLESQDHANILHLAVYKAFEEAKKIK